MRPLDPVTAYAEAVTSGKRLACKWERLACERHLRDLEAKAFHFDRAEARRRIGFFKQLRHYKGEHAGQSFELHPSQQFIIGSLYGWRMEKRGPRRFRYAYDEVPRKNGKTTLSAGVGIMGLLEEPGAEVYSVATKEDQSKIGWRDGRAMIKGSPGLTKLLTLRVKEIQFDRRTSFWKPLGSDSETLDGLNPSLALMDELHAWTNRDLWDVVDDGMGARAQPLIFQITTAGKIRDGICAEQRRHVCSILEQRVQDERYFGVIYTIDDGDDPHAPASWQKSNPLLGVAKSVEFMESQSQMAKAIPGKLNAFLNKQLNVWTENEVCWLNPEDWNACDGTPIDRAALRGLPCYGGLDLSTRIDLSAFVLWFPTINVVLPFFWMPKENIKRRVVQDRVPYDAWARDGLIETTTGNEIDYEVIRRRINDLSAEFEIRGIGFDPWNATQMSHWLQKDGAKIMVMKQDFGFLSAPTKKLEALILSRAIRHGGNPVLKWMAGNVVLLQDSNGNYRPNKGKSRERIDGIVAWIMALHFDVNPTEPPKQSVYKERGLFITRILHAKPTQPHSRRIMFRSAQRRWRRSSP